jgi:cell division protein FtsB
MSGDGFASDGGTGWGQVALTAGLLLALFYVGQNTLAGRHGLFALIENRQEINLLETELAQVQAERARIERDVELLSPPYVDQDLLDERARAELGYAREGELVIFRD